MRLPILAFFLLILFRGFSQSDNIDSLTLKLRAAGADSTKADLLNDLSDAYIMTDAEKALSSCEEALSLSQSLGYARGVYIAKKRKASALSAIGENEKAKAIYMELIREQEKAGNISELIRLYNNAAIVETYLGNYKGNINYLIAALRYADQKDDPALKRVIYENLGNNYANRKYYTQAMEYYKKAAAMQDRIGSEKDINNGTIYEKIGMLLMHQSKYPEALENFRLAEERFRKSNNIFRLAGLYSNMAFFYIEKNENANARAYVRKAISLNALDSRPFDLGVCLMNMSAAYFNEASVSSGQHAASFRDSSFFYLDSAGRIASRYKLSTLELDVLQAKIRLFTRTNHYDSAFKTLWNYTQLNDSLLSLEKDKEIHEINTRYGVDLKEKENLLLVSRNNDQRYAIIALSVLFVLLFLIALLVIRQSRLRQQQENMQLEQKLFRLQMNPHFIFNSLQAIQNYILKQDKTEALRYLSSFASLTRAVLENSRMELIPLRKEIALLENYFQLQKLRFGHRFDYSIHIDPALDLETTELPPMLSQPFIENALEHGMRDLESGGRIEVFFKMKDKDLLLEVTDNGKGIQKTNVPQHEHQSLALAITQERVELMNRKRSRKTMFSIGEAFPEAIMQKGVKVKFSIPL